MELKEERPAYVRFETRAIADKAESEKQGRFVAQDQDWALTTPPYSKDCVEQKVETWKTNMAFNVKNGRIPQAWMDMYLKQYDAFKEGQEIPLDGTSVKNWAALSPAQVSNCLTGGMKTVEDVALANDEGLRRLGMGGIELRNKAKAFLSSASSLVEENASLKTEVSQLKGSMEAMQQQITIMVAQGARTVEAPIVAAEVIAATDILEDTTIIEPEKKANPFSPAVQDPKLVAAYIEKFNKKPHPAAKDDTIRKKLKE